MGEHGQHYQGKHEQPKKDIDPRPLFELGQIVGTPGALLALVEAHQPPDELLIRHQTGDWGDICDEDKQENNLAMGKGFRIFSSYKLNTGFKVWVITEWDRSITTLLLPEDY